MNRKIGFTIIFFRKVINADDSPLHPSDRYCFENRLNSNLLICLHLMDVHLSRISFSLRTGFAVVYIGDPTRVVVTFRKNKIDCSKMFRNVLRARTMNNIHY